VDDELMTTDDTDDDDGRGKERAQDVLSGDYVGPGFESRA
jgi:hypothetical protein